MSTAPLHGHLLVEAVAAKDHERLRALLDPAVDFRAMTPRRFWEGTGPDDVVAALAQWFDDGDVVTSVEEVQTAALPGAERVGYRLRVTSGGRPHLVDQQAYLTVTGGRITWLRVMCAGFRPLDGT
ncbi:nuclear transport factor 2-like protein [Kineococcus sp. SYSU DK004]|uniref:hypothetical protein n=1 Tax=Kineococcus sp. SYSU DK004 TaxID=3383125 RepID=UPI003D7D3E07